MSSGKLSSPAEEIRQKIKGMIPDLSDQPIENRATLLETEDSGNKTYGGALLAEQITLLSKHLPISDPEKWGWRLLYFTVPTTVENKREKGYLIPLSPDVIPGGTLQEGFYSYITTSPKVNSGAAAIFFVPI